MAFLEELKWRGLLHQTAGEGIDGFLAQPGRVAYAGFDPTSDSLTIGNFIPIKMLMHWQQAGHRPLALMGGGTGLIGDPSGKSDERPLLTIEQVEANVAGQRRIFDKLLDFDAGNPIGARMLNNIDWLRELSYLDVLRDIGKYFSVNMMIQKESVAERLTNREHGISYTEFSYMILQGYDFLHLFQEHGCAVQLGGSDQFGNIVAGMDLIRRLSGRQASQGESLAYAITAPLVTRADGGKIGKTERGAVWLTADRTSPYAFYQYWINVTDADVIRFLKWFTFLSREAIQEIEEKHQIAPHERNAQRELGGHMTGLFHGKEELVRVESASRALFSGEVRSLDVDMLREVFADVPHSQHPKASLEGDGSALIDLLPETSLAQSKREAREFLSNGAVSVNGERVGSDHALTTADLLHGDTVLLRRGKKNWHAMKWA